VSEEAKPETGAIGWTDLTVENAQDVKEFYRQVVGWTVSEVDMGGYSDFCMNAPGTGRGVAGICHARGSNTGLPAQWLPYITVENLEASAARCEALGGKVLAGPKGAGGGARYCVIRDPAGAVAALYAPG
jgi:predicted enzyme related to lactoylglutathione lyase